MKVKELTDYMLDELKADLVCELLNNPIVDAYIPDDISTTDTLELVKYNYDNWSEMPNELLFSIYENWEFEAEEFYSYIYKKYKDIVDYKKPFNGLSLYISDIYYEDECGDNKIAVDIGFHEPAQLYFDSTFIDYGYASYRDFYWAVNTWLQIEVDSNTHEIIKIKQIWDTDGSIDGLDWWVSEEEQKILQEIIDNEIYFE